MSRISNRDTVPYIARREEFITHNETLTGHARTPNGFAPYTGRLPREHATESLYAATYIVYSYSTPIAWYSDVFGWTIPDVKYSVTTSRHQTLARMGAHR